MPSKNPRTLAKELKIEQLYKLNDDKFGGKKEFISLAKEEARREDKKLRCFHQ